MASRNKGPRLELNERGIWEVRWTEDRRSKRVSTRTADRQEASRFLAGFILEAEATKSHELNLGDIINGYLREHVEGGAVVDKERQRNIAKNLIPFFGALPPQTIDPATIAKYSRLRAAGSVGSRRAQSSGTLRRELNMLKAAIQHAVKTKRITPGDVPYIPLPAAPGAKDLWLTEGEADQFLAAADSCSDRGRLFAWIALHTASRRAAIETLRWDQVDLDARLIHFNPAGRAQSKKRRVAVPITDELGAVLRAIPREKRTGFVLGHSGSVFRAFQVICRRATEQTGNEKFLDATPHTLRHTWATLAARAGIPLYQIAGVLGDTLATVQNNYLHHSPDHLRGAVSFRTAKAA